MRRVLVVGGTVVLALGLVACGDDDSAAEPDPVEPSDATGPVEPAEPDGPGPEDRPDPVAPDVRTDWSGTVTVGDEVFELAIVECAFGDDVGHVDADAGYEFVVAGDLLGHARSAFEIDRRDDDLFGREDLAFVQIGDEESPDVYWEASVVSQEEQGADPLFLEVDGTTVRGEAWFEDLTLDDLGEMVRGTIDVAC